jgi:hypothetical protein
VGLKGIDSVSLLSEPRDQLLRDLRCCDVALAAAKKVLNTSTHPSYDSSNHSWRAGCVRLCCSTALLLNCCACEQVLSGPQLQVHFSLLVCSSGCASSG